MLNDELRMLNDEFGMMNDEFGMMKSKTSEANSEFRMKNCNKIPSLIIMLFVLCFSWNIMQAQSVDSLVSEALINNPFIKSLEYKIKSSEYRTNSVDALPPPTVGFELSQIPFNTIDWFNEPLSQNLTFSQMFPLGGKIDAMTNVEKSNIGISRDNLQVYKINLTANIKMSYFNLWLIEKKIEVQQESINLLNQLHNSIIKLYEINKISQADIFTVMSETAFNETQLLILQNQKESEIYKMNKLLGRDLNSKELVVEKELPVFALNQTQEELEVILAGNNPSLKRMNSMIEMNKYDIIANDKERIPDLMLQGMLMRMPRGMLLTTKSPLDMGDGTGSTDYGYGLMASVTLPFVPWSKGKFEAKEQEFQTIIQSIESEKSDMLREMNVQLKTAFVKMKTSLDLIKLYSENVIPLYEKARSAQVSAYQNNQTNINTVIDANRMILMQSMNYFMAQADYQMAVAEIEMMVGISVNK
ncbi:MAG: TolC family protein [Candidatus Kapabacteria bacterium]|nr:TolC family protein [Candidatus Kapabacteria bacterium]